MPSVPHTGQSAAAVRSAVLGDLNIVATMQGQRVLTEHLYTVAAITPPILQSLVGYFGVYLRETAKEFHTPNIDTGATYRSIQSGPVIPLQGGGGINVWVSTPYSKFLEFGFVHHLTGQWIFNPFMMPAADLAVPEFVSAVSQVANIVGNTRFLTGLAAASPANSMLQSARSALYSVLRLVKP